MTALACYKVNELITFWRVLCLTTRIQNKIVTNITANRSSVYVAEFRYLGKCVTNQNWFNEQIKSRLNMGEACYNSV
jgi:hypothetical protein